jgi:hypothetical protein
LNIAKNSIVGKSKNRRRTAEGFYVFLLRLCFLIRFLKKPCFKKLAENP